MKTQTTKKSRQSRPHYDSRLYDCGGGNDWLDRDYGSNGDGGNTAIAVDLCLGAVTGDVTGLAAAVACLAGSVEGTAVGGSAVAGDVAWEHVSNSRCREGATHTKLSTGVALHGLSLAITGEVVRSATLVAGSRASAASEAAPEASVAATGSTSTATHSWVGAVAGKVAGDTTAVAASAGTSSAQSQSRAVSLNVSEALAVIALLSYCFVSILVRRGLNLPGFCECAKMVTTVQRGTSSASGRF
jgi:hypothetical protein